jgi:hypothetical protein
MICRCHDGLYASVHTDVPELDLAATTAAHKLALTATL